MSEGPDGRTGGRPPYRDASLDVAARVEDLLGRMSLEEKVAQATCIFGAGYVDDPDGGTLDGLTALAGSMTHLLRASELPPRDAAQRLNAYQRRFTEGTRLGIPVLFSEEACCGPQVRGASMFPQAIGLAASWDPDLIAELARASRRQLLTLGIRQVFAPVCDVARDPRWGRLEETFGEDPYLVGEATTAFVRDIQGDDPATGTMATLKHFIGYSATEGGRNGHPAHIGPRVLREVYGLPFEMTIRRAGARAVMSSYNAIDQVPVQASSEILTGLLRDEYGFDGLVISDLNAVDHLHSRHHTAVGPREAGVQALQAGLDVELEGHAFGLPLIEAVRDGDVSEEEVDRAVRRVLGWKFRLGLFERPYADEDDVPEVLDTEADRELARRAAGRSIVLLHNPAGVLPLSTATGAVAVIGPNADRPLAMLGDYAYSTIQSAIQMLESDLDLGARGDAISAQAPATDQLELTAGSVPVVTVLEAIRSAVGGTTDVRYALGCSVAAPDRSGFQQAVSCARGADVAIVVVGDQSSLVAGGTVGEGIDSASCRLPGVQAELVEAVAATGTPVVLVLLHGRPFALGGVLDHVAAVVDAWFPGEEGGNAIADVLFGRRNPGGKSPVSYPDHVGVVPAPYNRAYGLDTYVDADLEAVFPFGHGLSYTTFAYDDLGLSADTVPTDGELRVSCTVRNAGDRTGDEVVQLYVRDVVARTVRPWIELKGFRRIQLAPGQADRVTFTLSADRFCLYDPADGWIVEPGRVELFVGSSSRDLRLAGEVTLVGSVRRLGDERTLVTPVDVAHVSPGRSRGSRSRSSASRPGRHR